MRTNTVLLLTDLIDSTLLVEKLGDDAVAALWEAHDRMARSLLRQWRGREIDKSDGFLLLFDQVEDAIGYALAYHSGLKSFEFLRIESPLRARAGLHCGAVLTRQNSADDIAWGAKAIEVEGIAKATAARIMSLALGGQTLMSAEALAALDQAPAPTAAQGPIRLWRTHSHGHWRLKGIAAPLELFEVGGPDAPFTPPPDSAKAYRVIRATTDWQPARELPHNLPAERDGFVGRHDALLDLAQRLDEGARLVSLLGIGGIGKTRLALRYARTWLGDYAGGAWFCDLSQARSQDGIVHAVAQALDVPLGKADPVQQLGAAIAGRGPCLVILDNYEQVARHAEATLGVWLERAPQARFIATSREVLGIAGEQALVLAPLAVDEAVGLFEQRMAAAGIGSATSAGDESTVKALVDLLDRLPLAIELAAARVRVMPVAELLRRMGERFKLLTSSGGRHDRQATLRATLDWSWDLLSAAEQSTLAQLSVFEGGFTLEAAEAVVALPSGGSARWVADVVQSLIEKSLVRSVPPHRFDLLRSVHEYAAERLFLTVDPSSSLGAARHRHWGWFGGMNQSAANRCLLELPNLTQACLHAARSNACDAAIGALTAAWSGIRLAGPFRAVLELVAAVKSCELTSTAARARALSVEGSVHQLLGQTTAALTCFEDAATLAASSNDLGLQASLLNALGNHWVMVGNRDKAQSALQSSLQLAIEVHDNYIQHSSLNELGVLAQNHGQLEQAKGRYEQALVCARRLDDDHWQGGVLGNLGGICHLQGKLDEAKAYYRQALSLVTTAGNRRWEGNIGCNLGLLLLDQGNSTSAAEHLTAALRVAREIGYPRLEATALCNLGIAHQHAGDLAAALGCVKQAVALANSLGDRRGEALFSTHLAKVHMAGRDLQAAARSLNLGEAALRDLDDPMSLALLLCVRCELEVSLNNYPQAASHFVEARHLANQSESTDNSELTRAIVRCEAQIASMAPERPCDS